MMFVCLARDAYRSAWIGRWKERLFFFFFHQDRSREKEKTDRDGGMEGQHSQALLISFLLLCFPAFSPLPPIYKSINVRRYVLCHCSEFKCLKRDVVCGAGRVSGVRPRPKACT